MSCNAGAPKGGNTGQKFTQTLTTQEPVFDKKYKVHRPRKVKSRQNPKFL